MNKHETERCQQIADDNLILLSEVGSTLHGCSVAEQDDLDLMGLCIEPAKCVIGLEPFDQYQFRTQPEGMRSGPGDIDKVIYSLRKWTRLAAAGNPTVLLLCFVPESKVQFRHDPLGKQISSVSELLISRECGRKFLGYLTAQRECMLGLRSKRTNRPELIDQYGFDTKFAYHALRLGFQGCEILEDGKVTLPMRPAVAELMREVRTGRYPKDHVIGWIDSLQERLEHLTSTIDLPEKADMTKVNRWLIEMYQEWWGCH